MERGMRGKILYLLILLSAVSLFFDLPQPLRFFPAFLQVFVLPGLVFTLLFAGKGFPGGEKTFFAILLSPVVLTLLVIAATVLTGGDVHGAARIALAALYAALAALVAVRFRSAARGEESTVPAGILAVSAAFAGVILVSYLWNPFLLIRSDSWYHASVVSEIAARGIPPMEPWLGDFPIRYMWFYHLFNAVWMDLSGLPLFWAMGVFNVVTALFFPLLVGRYVSSLTRKRYLVLSASILAVAGLESVSWVFVPLGLLRAFFGDVRGAAEIQRMLSAMVFDGAWVIHTLTPYGAWMVNLYDKFITITAFGYSLDLFLASLILVLDAKFLRESRARFSATLFTLVLGTLLFHAVTGMALVMAITGGGVLLLLLRRYLADDAVGPVDAIFPAAIALLAAAVGLPYILSLGAAGGAQGGGSAVSEHLHIGVRSIITILLPLLVLFVPARDAFRKLAGRRDYTSAVLACWAAVLLAAAVSINLPTVNDSKLIFPLFLLIGPPIYIEIAERVRNGSGAGRALLVSALAALFFLPLVLTVRGFLVERAGSELLAMRQNVTRGDTRFLDWMRDNTPDDAVIIENNDYHLEPVFAGRRNLYSAMGVTRVLGYGGPKMDLYRGIRAALFGRDGFSEDTVREMRETGLKLYVVVWRRDIESAPWLRERFSEDSEYFERVYEDDHVVLYALRGD